MRAGILPKLLISPSVLLVLVCVYGYILFTIYLSHNLSFLQSMGVGSQVLAIDNKFFFYFMNVQGTLAFILTAFAGPGLISPDLDDDELIGA